MEAELPGLPPEATGNVWVASVSESFHTLYDAEGILPRAQSEGFFSGEGSNSKTLLHFPEGKLKNWSNVEDVELIVRPHHAWISNILPLETVDEEAGIARTSLDATYVMNKLHFLKTTPNCWVENVLDELDEPGEWVLNTVEDKLYLWRRNDSPVVAPKLLELIRVEGKIDKDGPRDLPVRNLRFRGLTFMHGERYTLAPDDAGLQHDWDMLDKDNALVRFRGTENCAIEACHFLHSGSGAIRVDLYGMNNEISGNHIEYMGGGGILLCGYGPGTKDVNRQNLIYNNHIHHVGEIYWHSPGIFLWQSGDNRVANNLIHHTNYTALIISGCMSHFFMKSDGRELTRTIRRQELTNLPEQVSRQDVLPYLHSHDNLVEYNEIHHAMLRLGDGNAIYIRGAGEDNVIRRNYIHHMVGNTQMQAAIRTDGGQTGTLIAENLIYKCVSQGILLKLNNRAENNIIADIIAPPRGYYVSVREGPLTGASIQRNIFYMPRKIGTFFHELRAANESGTEDRRGRRLARVRDADTDYNLYFSKADQEKGKRCLEENQKNGVDLHSLATDPLFVDPDNGDFRLRPDSPALTLGFKPIDLSKTGLQMTSANTYYVSPAGNNSHSGTTEERPFQVIQFAIDRMSAGDTLIILDGFYTGSIQLKSGITLKAKHPRHVVFSGATPLKASFEPFTDKIYKTPVDQTVTQLFCNDKPMIWAQWPDIRWDQNWDEAKKWARARQGTGPGVLTSENFGEIEDLDLAGAYCFLRYGKGNSCYSRLVESFDGDTLHWNDDNFYSNKYTGEDGWRGTARALRSLPESHVYHPIHSKFFLAGDLDLLDAPGEWFVEDGLLYFFPPDGENPDELEVLVQTIDYCIYQDQAISDIFIDGIDFLGGSVKLTARGNNNIRFHNSRFSYPGGELLHIDKISSRDADRPIEIAGSNISMKNCLFAGARYTALRLDGSELSVKNCVFMENNRHATFEGRALGMNATGSFDITRNTFFNNCSDAIRIVFDQTNYEETILPRVAYNHIFNAGIYNSDVSGIYLPIRSQKHTEIHHNWMHNVKGNALRLDVAGKELNVHHNVFWQSKRGMSIEGYGPFNIYNNTDVRNHVPSDLIRNILNHAGAYEASSDSSFVPINDWNVINNIVEAFNDGIGPREKSLYASRKASGQVHSERTESDELHGRSSRPLEGNLEIRNRGSIQGNLIGEDMDIFTNGNLSGLNLMPTDRIVLQGVEPTENLFAQGVTYLNTTRGAYELDGDYWIPGSDWMPYGLEVTTSMAAAEKFAKAYHSISIVPQINISGLPKGLLQLPAHSTIIKEEP